MNLNPTKFRIDAILESMPIEQRYNWQEIATRLEEQGFTKGDFLWWIARYPKPKGNQI